METEKIWVTASAFPPRLNLNNLPEGERDCVNHIQGLLGQLFGYVNSFDAAIRLARRMGEEMLQLRQQHPEGGFPVPEPFHEYLYIAARDGAMSLYHFARVIDGIRSSQRNAPTLRTLVDDSRVRVASRLFSSQFPDFEQVRHAIAHAAELMATPESKKRNLSPENKIVIEGHELTIGDSFDEQSGKFFTTIEGRRVSYELSQESLVKLVRIQREIYSAFDGAT